MIPYGRQSISEEDIAAVCEVLRGDWLTQGPTVDRFERALAEYCGAKYAVAMSNGTVALHLACLAAGLGHGDEGITSPITFAASANCMLYCGATPRFSDIQWNTWNIDPVAIIKGIGVKTKVLIPVDFAGLPCDLEAIRKIADEHRLIVIEDACHALGASYKGKKIGGSGFSDMTVFSFHPVKHITTGEGGAVLTDDAVLAKRLRKLRHHGITKDPAEMRENHGPWYYEIQELGYNARITDIQCGLGLSQLKNLDNFLVRRREIATRYREWFSAIPGLTVQGESRGSVNAFHLFVVHLDPSVYCRKTVFETLVLEGVNPQVHYIPLHLQPAYKQSTGCDCVMANHYYTGAISLPMYPALTDKDLRTVWDAFNIAVKAGRL